MALNISKPSLQLESFAFLIAVNNVRQRLFGHLGFFPDQQVTAPGRK
jgi:hypothetical protein